ncbi:MAG: carboxypeptidase regulatory-like domain-containing protein [Planctomycetaceae bacterium]
MARNRGSLSPQAGRRRLRALPLLAGAGVLALLASLLLSRALAPDRVPHRTDAEDPREEVPPIGPDDPATPVVGPQDPGGGPAQEVIAYGDKTLPRELCIRGRVTDDKDRPVGDAVVAAFLKETSVRPHEHRRAARVRSEADGTFVLGPLSHVVHSVVAVKEGMGIAIAENLFPGGWIDLVLAPGAALRGTVNSAENGEALSGARVIFLSGPYAPETTTDAEGRYTFALLPPTRNLWQGDQLLAVAEGFRRGERSNLILRPGEDATVDFALLRGDALTGTVTHAGTGRPLAGAVVAEGLEPYHRTALSDAEGRYRLDHVEIAANAVFHARAEGFLSLGSQSDGSPVLDFALTPARTLRVTVRGRDGSPAAGARVYLHRVTVAPGYEGSGARPGMGGPPRVAGADGSALFDDVHPGQVAFVAFHPRFAPGESKPLDVPADGAPPGDVLLELPAGFRIEGDVRDGQDRPLPDVQVRLYPGQAWGGEKATYQFVYQYIWQEATATYSDAGGRFVVDAAMPGRQQWLAAMSATLGWSGVQVDGVEGQRVTGVQISFAGSRITGTLLTAGGEPVPFANIQAQGPLNAKEQSWRHVVTDGLGRFHLGGLKEGSYNLSAYTAYGSPPPLQGIPGGTENVEMRLAAMQTIRGRVRSLLTRRPLDRFTLLILPQPAARGSRRVQPPTSWQGEMRSPDGEFERSVAPGTYVVMVRAAGHAPGIARDVVVEENVAPRRIELDLDGGASLRGLVKDPEGRPARFVPVQMRRFLDPGESGGPEESLSQMQDQTDASGRYIFEGVGPGRYLLTVNLGRRGSGVAPATVRGSEVVETDLQILPTGKVRFTVKDEEGKPLAAVSLSLQDDSGQWLGWARWTDDTGITIVEGIRQGRCKAILFHQREEYVADPVEVEVIPDATVSYEVTARKKG